MTQPMPHRVDPELVWGLPSAPSQPGAHGALNSGHPKGGLRVSFVVRALDTGGAQRQLASLAGGLRQRGLQVQVITYYPGGQFVRELESAGVEVRSLDKRGRWDLFGPMLRLRGILREFRPDVIHGYMPDANVLSLIAGRLLVHAKVVWGLRSSDYELDLYDRFFRFLVNLSRRMSRFADLCIANSEAGRSYHLAHGYPADRVRVVPNGIDTRRYSPDPARRAAQRARWGVTDDELLIGLVARLDPMKDHPAFLRAAAAVAQHLPAARFVCVGDGPSAYVATLRALADSLGVSHIVRWEQDPEDISAAYNALDLLVSCSSSGEGFSNALGEAMACGVRCVVTNVGDSARIVGETGEVVAPRDPVALAEAIRRRLERQDDLGAAARQRIVEHFGHDRMVIQTVDLLGALFPAGGV